MYWLWVEENIPDQGESFFLTGYESVKVGTTWLYGDLYQNPTAGRSSDDRYGIDNWHCICSYCINDTKIDHICSK